MTSNKNISVQPAFLALASALLFGASTPCAKLLIGQLPPQLLAGCLYLGAGIGLFLLHFCRNGFRKVEQEFKPKQSDWPWLIGAISFGGILGPLLLMIGLKTMQAGAASLLLNLEAVFTALLAWFVFQENFDRRIFLGMVSIIVGSLILSWQPDSILAISTGFASVVAACFCWAIDNNLTRNISALDPVGIAASKGFVAGLVNCSIALQSNNSFNMQFGFAALIVGFIGYGLSLVLYIQSLRRLGTARTGAYFSTAPFAGAIISILFLHEPLTINLMVATAFMILGVWLHLTELHEHEHLHPEEEHSHLHYHDEHHQHEHDPEIPMSEPHAHWHKHMAIKHSHPHFPDADHRHTH